MQWLHNGHLYFLNKDSMNILKRFLKTILFIPMVMISGACVVFWLPVALVYWIITGKAWEFIPLAWVILMQKIYDLSHINPYKWHPFTHADILEALGEDWAMTWDGRLLHYENEVTPFWTCFDEEWKLYAKLPQNLSDLSLPEYEETRKQLIQLLTK